MEQTDIKLNDQEKAFIKELLEETQPLFRDNFLELANSKKKEDKENFMKYRTILEEFIVPKQGKRLPCIQENIKDILSQIKKGIEEHNAAVDGEFHACLPHSVEITCNLDDNSIHFTIPLSK